MAFFSRLSHAMGSRRRFVRRMAGLCLILLGVHAAADRLDDLAYASLDALDLALDRGFVALFEWLGDLGILTLPRVSDWSEGVTAYVGVSEKDRMALVFGLLIELSADLLLLDLAWGLRKVRQPSTSAPEFIASLRRSAHQLKEALHPLDVEKVFVPIGLFVLCLCGAALSAVATEMLLFDLFGGWTFLGGWDRLIAASSGLLVALLLVLRFGPDLVEGALSRADQRGHRFASQIEKRRSAQQKQPLKSWQQKILRSGRGWLSALFVLPITGLSLFSMGPFFDLLQRLGTLP
jgi:hypothetical protein